MENGIHPDDLVNEIQRMNHQRTNGSKLIDKNVIKESTYTHRKAKTKKYSRDMTYIKNI